MNGALPWGDGVCDVRPDQTAFAGNATTMRGALAGSPRGFTQIHPECTILVLLPAVMRLHHESVAPLFWHGATVESAAPAGAVLEKARSETSSRSGA